MRLIAVAFVIFSGAVLLAVDSLPDTRAAHIDDLANFCIVFGLLAMGVELYVVPIIKWKLKRD